MRRYLHGVILALAAFPAWAQTASQPDKCFSVPATAEETIADCTKAIESKRSPSAYHNRGVQYFLKGLYPKGLADLTKAVELSGVEKTDFVSDCLVWRGHTHEKLGQRGKAIADYREALNRDATNKSAQEKLKSYGVKPR